MQKDNSKNKSEEYLGYLFVATDCAEYSSLDSESYELFRVFGDSFYFSENREKLSVLKKGYAVLSFNYEVNFKARIDAYSVTEDKCLGRALHEIDLDKLKICFSFSHKYVECVECGAAVPWGVSCHHGLTG